MALAAARARVPELVIAPHDPIGDAAALDRLVAWCGRYAPWVAADPQAGGVGSAALLIDLTGAAHLFGGEQALAEDLLAHLTRFGQEARIAVAASTGAAWALARFSDSAITVVPPESPLAEVLAPLPPAALRLPPAATELLRRFGLTTIGALSAIPAASLAPRFGDEVSRRLRQALGQLPEPISPQSPPEMPSVRRLFPEPLTAPEDRDRTIALLLSDLTAELARRGLGARRLELLAFRTDGTLARLGIGTSQPNRDARHLERLFVPQREALDPGYGFEVFVLSAPHCEPMTALQLTLAAGRETALPLSAPADSLAALVDRLEARLGSDTVRRPLPRAEHRPERAQRLAPAFAAQREPWRLAAPRPLYLLRRPEPVEAIALLPDQAPARFTWRRVAHRVRRAEGPERLEPAWWRPEEAVRRDYFRVEDEAGRRFWLFRTQGAAGERWFLQGLFA